MCLSSTRHYAPNTDQLLTNYSFITRSLALSLAPRKHHKLPDSPPYSHRAGPCERLTAFTSLRQPNARATTVWFTAGPCRFPSRLAEATTHMPASASARWNACPLPNPASRIEYQTQRRPGCPPRQQDLKFSLFHYSLVCHNQRSFDSAPQNLFGHFGA